MIDDKIPLFSFRPVHGKKVTAAFDGGRISSDGGVMLLAMAERENVKGKKHHILVDTQGFVMHVLAHTADAPDRDGGAVAIATLSVPSLFC